MAELEKHVGKLISLPPLPETIGNPKGFGYEEKEFFLLSKQRFSILKEMIDWNKLPLISKPFGLTFSGPSGLGKSALGLLHVVYGFVNEWIVIPVV